MERADSFPTQEQLERLAQCDESVVNEISEGSMSHIENSVDWFIKTHAGAELYRDDLIGESILAVHEWLVTSASGKKFPVPFAFVGYINKIIVGACVDFLNDSNVSSMTKVSGYQLTRHDLKETHRTTDGNEVFSELEFDDFVEAAFDETEKTVITLLLQGLSPMKIAPKVGLSLTKTRVLVHDIRERFRKANA